MSRHASNKDERHTLMHLIFLEPGNDGSGRCPRRLGYDWVETYRLRQTSQLRDLPPLTAGAVAAVVAVVAAEASAAVRLAFKGGGRSVLRALEEAEAEVDAAAGPMTPDEAVSLRLAGVVLLVEVDGSEGEVVVSIARVVAMAADEGEGSAQDGLAQKVVEEDGAEQREVGREVDRAKGLWEQMSVGRSCGCSGPSSVRRRAPLTGCRPPVRDRRSHRPAL